MMAMSSPNVNHLPVEAPWFIMACNRFTVLMLLPVLVSASDECASQSFANGLAKHCFALFGPSPPSTIQFSPSYLSMQLSREVCARKQQQEQQKLIRVEYWNLATALGELWHCRYDPTSLDQNGSHHGTSGNLDNAAVSSRKIPLFACTMTMTMNYWHECHVLAECTLQITHMYGLRLRCICVNLCLQCRHNLEITWISIDCFSMFYLHM